MKNKKVILLIVVFLIIVSLILVILLNKNINWRIKNKNNSDDQQSILIGKTIYNYPKVRTIVILENGDIKENTKIDELSLDKEEKLVYNKIKTITNENLEELKSMIADMTLQKQDQDKYSKDIGLFIKIDGDLYSTEYFEQEKVDKLNDYFESLID